ncbi:hypothetical protein F9C11_20275 [Amycolatopsis sp. VS8301801F10]|uniref:hypothetical protein n=1 Tax=unclassified Amycolatopsis TaxID=2618356 RepID=UPI0038FD03F0
MSRRLFWFVIFAAGTTAVAVADSVVRNQGNGFSVLPDEYQTLVRVIAVGLWMLAGISFATREVIDHIDRSTEKAMKELLTVVGERTQEVLKVVDHRKRRELDAMFKEFGLPPQQRDDEPTALDAGGTIELASYRRRGNDRN